MKHRYASKSALFLMELLIAILVFAFTSAICMRIFVFAKLTTDVAGELNSAVTIIQNAAECYKAYNGDKEKMLDTLNWDTEITADGYVEYDIDGNLIFKLTPDANESNKCFMAVYSISSGEEIFSLHVNAFYPEVN